MYMSFYDKGETERAKYSTFDFFKVTMFAGMAGEICYKMPSMHVSLSVLS